MRWCEEVREGEGNNKNEEVKKTDDEMQVKTQVTAGEVWSEGEV